MGTDKWTLAIQGKEFPTLDEFFDFLAGKLSFPDYFNGNLNSFEEVINDLSWLSNRVQVIELELQDSAVFLKSEKDSIKEQILAILRLASKESSDNNPDEVKPSFQFKESS